MQIRASELQKGMIVVTGKYRDRVKGVSLQDDNRVRVMFTRNFHASYYPSEMVEIVGLNTDPRKGSGS